MPSNINDFESDDELDLKASRAEADGGGGGGGSGGGGGGNGATGGSSGSSAPLGNIVLRSAPLVLKQRFCSQNIWHEFNADNNTLYLLKHTYNYRNYNLETRMKVLGIDNDGSSNSTTTTAAATAATADARAAGDGGNDEASAVAAADATASEAALGGDAGAAPFSNEKSTTPSILRCYTFEENAKIRTSGTLKNNLKKKAIAAARLIHFCCRICTAG